MRIWEELLARPGSDLMTDLVYNLLGVTLMWSGDFAPAAEAFETSIRLAAEGTEGIWRT